MKRLRVFRRIIALSHGRAGRAETAETWKFLSTYQKDPLKKMEKSKDNAPVMMEKPNDLTLEQCQEAFAMFRLHIAKVNQAQKV